MWLFSWEERNPNEAGMSHKDIYLCHTGQCLKVYSDSTVTPGTRMKTLHSQNLTSWESVCPHVFYGTSWEQGPRLISETTTLSLVDVCIYVFVWKNEKYLSSSSSSNYRRKISNRNQERFVLGLPRISKNVYLKGYSPSSNKVGTNSQHAVPDLPQSTRQWISPGRRLWLLHFLLLFPPRQQNAKDPIYLLLLCIVSTKW